MNIKKIEESVNKGFNPISDKINNLSDNLFNDFYFPEGTSEALILDSFILPITVLNKMEESIYLSLSTDKEVGFNLCLYQNELINDKQQIGETSEIITIRTCEKGKYVGKFHTHPPNRGGNSNLSIFDLANIYHDGIGCVGGSIDGLICFHIRKNDITDEDTKKIVTFANKFEKLRTIDGKLNHKDKLEYTKEITILQKYLCKTFLIEEMYDDEIYDDE